MKFIHSFYSSVVAAGAGSDSGAIFLQNTSGSPVDKIEIGMESSQEAFDSFYIGYTNVPEPSTYIILGTSLGLLAFVMHKRKQKQTP